MIIRLGPKSILDKYLPEEGQYYSQCLIVYFKAQGLQLSL